MLTGRTNTPEFGVRLSESDRWCFSRNPWQPDRIAGGSSRGAAAAVAMGMFTVAHGNDGGGSIRTPASSCGLVGLKVSRGRVPDRAMSADALAVEGIVNRDVADTAAVLDVISGPDRGAWYSAPVPNRPFLSEVGTETGRLRIGLVDEAPFGIPMDLECAEAAREAASVLEKIGHHVDRVSFGLPDGFDLARAHVANAALSGDDVEWEKAGAHIRAGRAAAQAVDSLTYVRSVQDLQRFSRDLVSRWGNEFDILLTPTMATTPPRINDFLAAPDPVVLRMGAFTRAFNVTGQPAISLPTHMSADGLPTGVQLVAGPWEEALLLRVASQLEEALPWAGRRPPIT